MKEDGYFQFKKKAHQFIMGVYDKTAFFPKEEIYGVISQLRRAAVSIMLNYVEGHGRIKSKIKQNFFEISYGSMRECKYLLFLSKERGWLQVSDYNVLFKLLDELGAMAWTMIQGIKDSEID